MPNNIELITKYSSQAWDKVYKREAISSLFDAQPGLFQFTGAKTVKIAQWQSGGLSDYSRNNEFTGVGEVNGYQRSSMQLTWTEYTIEQDRAAKILIEKFDDEETDGLAVGATTTELSRTVIIPEVDAYTFAKIYKSAATVGLGNVISGTVNGKPLEALNAGFTYLDNVEVPAENQMIFVSPNYLNLLRNTTEVTKFLSQGDYDKNVSFKMTEYEGRKLVVVPPQRFNTEVVLEKNGYRVAGTPIDFMIVPKDAVTHIVKYNKVKVLEGDLALAASNQDGFAVYARVYHDVFVIQNKRLAIYAHTGATTYTGVATGTLSLTVKQDATGKVKEISLFPAHIYAARYQYVAAANDGQVVVGNAAPTSDVTDFKVGDTISAAVTAFAVDSYGKVLAKVSLAAI